jgi:flagellar biosynthesis protein FlhG
MMDQAYNLREMSASYNTPVIITVTSGKGGVGKSNLVVNLAIALQKMGKNVMIFDADIGMGNDDILLGCTSKNNIYDLITENLNIEDILIYGPYGIKLLPGGSGINRVEDLTDKQKSSLLDKISHLKGLDYIIIDTGGGINRNILSFSAFCELLIVVITTEPTSLTDAYSLLKAINHFKLKKSANIIVNKAASCEDALNSFNKLKRTVKHFLNMDLDFYGMISDDQKVAAAVKEQSPFIISYPNSAASKDILRIAMKLTGENTEAKNRQGFENFIKKIFNVFS